jgi:hypothetical protein
MADIPHDERLALLEEAFRTVEASHGCMSNVPHYIGCILTGVIVVSMMFAGMGIVWCVIAGAPAYFGALITGVIMWRRSVSLELQRVVSKLVAARARQSK